MTDNFKPPIQDEGVKATHVYLVGAGSSCYAGLPLQAAFTEALLEPGKDESNLTKAVVEYLAKFIRRTFDHSTSAKAWYWPNLEDVFTSVDLAANTGHHLGVGDPPSTYWYVFGFRGQNLDMTGRDGRRPPVRKDSTKPR